MHPTVTKEPKRRTTAKDAELLAAGANWIVDDLTSVCGVVNHAGLELELKNAIRWTFRRMYEKVTAKPA